MKIKELMELLKGFDPDTIVVMSKDAEGNGYSPLTEISSGDNYVAENSWSGYVGPPELTDELRDEGYSEEDIVDGVPCIVLWPTN